ncbi:MAG: hypothetical protein LBH43_06720 [Treponema sp.]|nr:hypothetical protein [Treponema sp.]
MNGRDNRGRRRPFRGRNSDRSERQNGNAKDGKPRTDFQARKAGEKPGSGKKGSPADRLNWAAPIQSTEPMPVFNCARCSLPITDSYSAVSEKNGEKPVHFDCVLAELNEYEKLDAGDVLAYIGGGRFGIVHYNNGSSGEKNFTIKKILEWENKDQRAQWRDAIADHYSLT